MKTFKNLALIALVAVFTFSFTKVNAQQKEIKIANSKVIWKGYKVTGSHEGTINLKSGFLTFNDNKLTGGEFVMDMTTIKNTDIKSDKYRGDLEKHLRSDDFFGVQKFPESKFVIKESKYLTSGSILVKGEITIKGITKPLEFEVDSHKHGESVYVSGLMVIDRTQFDIRYGSGSFFDNLGDRTINNDFEIKFDLMF